MAEGGRSKTVMLLQVAVSLVWCGAKWCLLSSFFTNARHSCVLGSACHTPALLCAVSRCTFPLCECPWRCIITSVACLPACNIHPTSTRHPPSAAPARYRMLPFPTESVSAPRCLLLLGCTTPHTSSRALQPKSSYCVEVCARVCVASCACVCSCLRVLSLLAASS